MNDDTLSFPDEPRAQLDTVLGDLVERAREVMATQGRLRALLRANQAVVESLDLDEVLRRIVEAATELVGARYGALGVVAPNGSLERFIHVGFTEDQVKAIGRLPQGHGLLGALIDDPRPIRLEHIRDDPRSSGFPAHHPAMEGFLGVPIRVRETVFGNLYLSNPEADGFSADDEQLVMSLAATAGYAIENARLFAETKRRQAWAAASAEVTAAMLSTEQEHSLAILLSRVRTLADADLVHLAVLTDGEIEVALADGLDAELLTGRRFPTDETVAGRAFEGRQPLLVNDGSGSAVRTSDGRSFGPIMALPMLAAGEVEGVLVVSRLEGSAAFTPADLDMASDFAAQGRVALELIRARSNQQRMALLEDRTRIARDLHDHVIQQLFGTGLELQSLAGAAPDPVLSNRLMQSVGNLDVAIAQIRTAIFALTAPAGGGATIRHQLIDLANDISGAFGRVPSVGFAGPVDLVVTGTLADDVLAVAREGLTNVVKHSGASAASLHLRTEDDMIELVVTDDGHGMAESSRRSGVANLEERARARGGTMTIKTGTTGTRLTWAVPVPSEGERGDE